MFFKGWIGAEGIVASVDERPTRGGTKYDIVFTYKVNEHWCSGSFTSYSNTRVGDTVYLRYDPKDPDRNDLSQENSWTQWGVWIGGGLFAIVLFLIHSC